MDLSTAYKKLTKPFATNKNAHAHNKNIGKAKNKEINKSKEANKSIKLKTSPVIINNPFKSKSPAQKRINCIG